MSFSRHFCKFIDLQISINLFHSHIRMTRARGNKRNSKRNSKRVAKKVKWTGKEVVLGPEGFPVNVSDNWPLTRGKQSRNKRDGVEIIPGIVSSWEQKWSMLHLAELADLGIGCWIPSICCYLIPIFLRTYFLASRMIVSWAYSSCSQGD